MGSAVLLWATLTSHVLGVPFQYIVGARHKLSTSGHVMLGGVMCDAFRKESAFPHAAHLPEPVLLSISYFLEDFL